MFNIRRLAVTRLAALSIVSTALLAACGAPAQNPDAASQPVDSVPKAVADLNWDSVFGVANMRGDTICMETNSSRIPASGNFFIVLPESGQTIPARIEERLTSCPGRELIAVRETSYYRVAADAFSGLGIAVLIDSVQASAGGRTDLDRDGSMESYRTCTSGEGVHLTAWSGEPLRSRRLWRYYYYLGYDTEPTCTEADYAG